MYLLVQKGSTCVRVLENLAKTCIAPVNDSFFLTSIQPFVFLTECDSIIVDSQYSPKQQI